MNLSSCFTFRDFLFRDVLLIFRIFLEPFFEIVPLVICSPDFVLCTVFLISRVCLVRVWDFPPWLCHFSCGL